MMARHRSGAANPSWYLTRSRNRRELMRMASEQMSEEEKSNQEKYQLCCELFERCVKEKGEEFKARWNAFVLDENHRAKMEIGWDEKIAFLESELEVQDV